MTHRGDTERCNAKKQPEARLLVLDAIIALPLENVALLVQRPLIFSMCTWTKLWMHKIKYHHWQSLILMKESLAYFAVGKTADCKGYFY
jgi:hypothetical protein